MAYPACRIRADGMRYSKRGTGRNSCGYIPGQEKKGWCQIAAEHITTVAALTREIKDTAIFCGEINPVTMTQIKKLFKTKAVLPGPAARLRRAAYMAELGISRQAAGTYDNLATLQPLYLRRPPITERKKA